MANVSGPQPDIKFCPKCKGDVENIPRERMISSGHRRKDGTVSEHTHSYECKGCKTRFEINQAK